MSKINDIKTWVEFVNVLMEKTEDAKSHYKKSQELMEKYPVQFWFLTRFLRDPSKVNESKKLLFDLPFEYVNDTIQTANDIIANGYKPPKNILLDVVAGDNFIYYPNYQHDATGMIIRASSPFDRMLVDVMSNIKGRTVRGQYEISQTVLDGILLYSWQLPIISYFISLPFLTTSLFKGFFRSDYSNSIAKIELDNECIKRYEKNLFAGIEILLLMIWNYLGEGEMITDEYITLLLKPLFIGKQINFSINKSIEKKEIILKNNDWICGKCNSHNNIDNDTCTKCGEIFRSLDDGYIVKRESSNRIKTECKIKPKPDKDIVFKNNDWICGACKNQNGVQNNICKKCGKKFGRDGITYER